MDSLILAGGENRRMPLLKSFLQVEDRSIIDSNVELLKGIFDRVIISTNDPEIYFYLNVILVGDIMEERGPMTGILSALSLPGVAEVFVTADGVASEHGTAMWSWNGTFQGLQITGWTRGPPAAPAVPLRKRLWRVLAR